VKKFLYLFMLPAVMILNNCEKNGNSILNWNESDTSVVAKKPNIYIYPQNSVDLDIYLHFPAGGEVIASNPAYQSGWHISVEPGGVIDGSYRYLFYEAAVPDRWQQEQGWIIPKDSLATFFRQNMHQSGFIEEEIHDFLGYWIPVLSEPYYEIYPQFSEQINPIIKLEFSEQPDQILRMYYLIRPGDPSQSPPELPHIPVFERTGFHIVEWGGIMP